MTISYMAWAYDVQFYIHEYFGLTSTLTIGAVQRISSTFCLDSVKVYYITYINMNGVEIKYGGQKSTCCIWH